MSNTSPNLLFVFPDQMRGSAMGFLGEEPVITPILDRFAKESLFLPNAVSNYPVCSPYRGMFMSGMYPFSNRVISNCADNTEPYGVELQVGDRCWSDILKDQGYSLGYIGKWHLESPRPPYIHCRINIENDTRLNEWTPPERRHGFDFWYAYGTYDYHMRPMYWRTHAGREKFHFVDQWGPEHEADLAIQYIENPDGALREPGKPFALVVSMNPPHMPYEYVPEKYVDAYDHLSVHDLSQRPTIPPEDSWGGYYYRNYIRKYYAMITGVDEQFGRILQTLEAQGLSQDTLVVFTSDHGNCLGIHDHISKGNAYEESLRVPFLIRWPGHIPSRQDPLLLSAPDIYPTLIELMGFGTLIPERVEGTSFARLFLGEEMVRPTSAPYMQIPYNRPSQGERGLRTGQHTLVRRRIDGKPDEVSLFDNLSDPYQMENIAGLQPDLVAALTAEMQAWLTCIHDPWRDDPGS
jgi:arylsulfatase A-like enzyme